MAYSQEANVLDRLTATNLGSAILLLFSVVSAVALGAGAALLTRE